jgi:hypothetical protein
LAETWGKTGEAQRLWERLGDRKPTINPRPGIVVANYDPTCSAYSGYDRQAETFVKNGQHSHHNRLTSAGMTVRLVTGPECSAGIFDVPLSGERI